MKEFKSHNSNNLISIKSIENNLFDRKYFIELNRKLLFMTSGLVYIQASRPNYIFNIDEFRNDDLIIGNQISNCNFNEEICFFIRKDSNNLLNFLTKIWFSFEHISFCYTDQDFINFDLKRKSWSEIVKNIESFVVFKGIEDDVVWIGKSEKLSFEFLK